MQRQTVPVARPGAGRAHLILRCGLIGLLLAALPHAAMPAEPAGGAPSVSGVVLDPLGQAIEGVMILVSNDRFVSALHTTLTDHDGRFEFPGLAPGNYQLAASKPGYQVRVTSLDTVLRRSIDFVLRPLRAAAIPDPAPEKGTATLEWILRVPTVDVLRDLNPPPIAVNGVVTDDGSAVPGGPAAELPTVHGEVVHLELGNRPAGNQASAIDAGGRSSQVRMQGEVSDLLEWHFLGDLRSLNRMPDSGPEAVAAGREFQSHAMSMGVDFNPTSDDDLSVSLLYGSARSQAEDAVQGPPSPETGNEQRTWGYNARWSRVLDPMSNLDVRLSFLQGQVVSPGVEVQARAADSGTALDHSLWDAGGSYSLAVDDNHQVVVGMRTRVYRGNEQDGAGVVLAVPGLSFPDGAELQKGWDLDLYGQDRWALSQPFEIISSLAYSRSDDSRGEEFVIPKVVFQHTLEDGTVWNAGLLVAWSPRVANGGAADPEAEAAQLGYQLGLTRPLPQGFRLSVSAESHPARGFNSMLESDQDFLAAPAVAGDGLYMAHRRVEARELDLQVEKQFRYAIGRLGSTFGEAQGRLATGWEELNPVVRMNEASMRYLATRLETVLPASDTEFRLGFRKLSEQSDTDLSEMASSRSYSVVDLLVAQRLAFLENLSRSEWRVVVAYQDVTADAVADGSQDQIPDPAETYSRLSGGIEVRF